MIEIKQPTFAAQDTLKEASTDHTRERDVGAEHKNNLHHGHLHTIHLEPHKRLKTFGEKKFNLLAYVGVGLFLNEFVSPIIATQMEEGIGKKYYEKFKSLFTQFDGKKYVPDYVGKGYLPKVLLVLIGGTLIVPIIKWLEDNKSPLVRKFDRKHYGERADTDPAIVEAHKEMDEVPKQGWGSLLKGRLTVMGSAIAVDSLVGWQEAPSTKLFKDSPTYQKYSSMQRVATQWSQKIMNAFKMSPSSRQFWDSKLQSASWCLVLSTTMVTLFYITSRIFARKRDEKIEHKEYVHTHPGSARDEVLSAADATVATSGRPNPQVNAVVHEKTLTPADALVQAV